MPSSQIPEKDWIAFLEKQYSEEHLYVQPNRLGTVGFIRAVEEFVLSRLTPNSKGENAEEIGLKDSSTNQYFWK